MFDYKISVEFKYEGKEVYIAFKPLQFPNSFSIGDNAVILGYNLGRVGVILHHPTIYGEPTRPSELHIADGVEDKGALWHDCREQKPT